MTQEQESADLDPSLFVEEEPEQKTEPAQDESHEQESDSEPDIPEKYRGKSAMDIIRMHQDAEKLLGKQGNEVGQLRGIVDDLLAVQKTSTPDPAPQETETDFFADPKKATEQTVNALLSNNPDLQGIRNELDLTRKERAGRALLSAHPDAKEISESEEFGKWISKSEVRMRMFKDAHHNFDPATASELMSLYKESKRVSKNTANHAAQDRTKDVAQASTGSGKSSSESRGKPILSRERLIELKNTNPSRYYASMDKIKEAYREGRVK